MGIYLDYYLGSRDGLRGWLLGGASAWWAAWVEESRLMDPTLPRFDDPLWERGWGLRRLTAAARGVPRDWDAKENFPSVPIFRLALRLRRGDGGVWQANSLREERELDALVKLMLRDLNYYLRYCHQSGDEDRIAKRIALTGLAAPAELVEFGQVKWWRYPHVEHLPAAPPIRRLWGFLRTGRSVRQPGDARPHGHSLDGLTSGWFSYDECALLAEALQFPPGWADVELSDESLGHETQTHGEAGGEATLDPAKPPPWVTRKIDKDHFWPEAAVERVQRAASAAVALGCGLFFVAA